MRAILATDARFGQVIMAGWVQPSFWAGVVLPRIHVGDGCDRLSALGEGRLGGVGPAALPFDFPIEPSWWHSYRGALRGESPGTKEGRNGPTTQNGSG